MWDFIIAFSKVVLHDACRKISDGVCECVAVWAHIRAKKREDRKREDRR